MANTVECPSCQHSWPASEAVLGLQSCPSCGLALEVSRLPVVWIYEAVEVTVVKEKEPHPFLHEDTD